MKKIWLVLFLILFSIPAFSIPQQIYFQGILLDSSGDAVSGSRDMVFSIYSVETGGAALWTETHAGVPVSSGLYTAKLGATTSLTSTIFNGNDRYIGITVGTDSEMVPRIKVLSVPYVYQAANADAAINSDTVDNFHAGSTPTAGYLLPLSAAGTFPVSVIPQGPGSTLNADLLDGYQATDFALASGNYVFLAPSSVQATNETDPLVWVRADNLNGVAISAETVQSNSNLYTLYSLSATTNSGGSGSFINNPQFGTQTSVKLANANYAGEFEGSVKMDSTLEMDTGVSRSNVSDSPGASAFHLITNNAMNSNSGNPYYIPSASLFSVTSGSTTTPALSVFQSTDTISWRGLKIPAFESHITSDFYVIGGDPGGEPQVIVGYIINPNVNLAFYESGKLGIDAETIDFNGSIESGVVPAGDSAYDLGALGARWGNVFATTYYGNGSNLTGLSGFLTTAEGDARYVNITGDNMTNTLTVSSSSISGHFITDDSSGYAIYGDATATGGGVLNYGAYLLAQGDDAIAVYGRATGGGANYGGYFWASGNTARGVYGRVSHGSGVNYGGYFTTQSDSGYGLLATNESGATNRYSALLATPDYAGQFKGDVTVEGDAYVGGKLTVIGVIDADAIVLEPDTGTTKAIQVRDTSDTWDILTMSQDTGLWVTVAAPSGRAFTSEASGNLGTAVYGLASSATGPNYGGYFESKGQDGRGVYGLASYASATNYGGYFESAAAAGIGVYGFASDGSGTNYGGYFKSNSTNGTGVYGYSPDLYGVRGVGGYAGGSFEATQNDGNAVFAYATSGGLGGVGVYAKAALPGKALVATNAGEPIHVVLADRYNGLYTTHEASGNSATLANNAYAGYFIGNVDIQGTLSKTAGTFKIDHPLDPANKVLRHSFVESPKMMNIYNGRAKLVNGKAIIKLPDYFDALNHPNDREIKLTCVNGWAPLYLDGKIENNQFVIRTTKEGDRSQEFSWMITAVRNDAYAKDHPIIVEEEKEEKGIYLYPSGFNKKHESN